MAHRETVEYCGSPSSLIATPSAARRCAIADEPAATMQTRTLTIAPRRTIAPPHAGHWSLTVDVVDVVRARIDFGELCRRVRARGPKQPLAFVLGKLIEMRRIVAAR